MLVQESFDLSLQALDGKPQTSDFISSMNASLDIISNALWSSRSDFLKQTLSKSIVAGSSIIMLPSTFLGWIESPYLLLSDGATVRLSPLKDNEDVNYLVPGTPARYEMRGNSMAIFPTPNINATLKGKIYERPSVTCMTDTVPFDGYFDSIINDVVIQVAQLGTFAVSNPAFVQTITSQITKQLRLRAPKKAYFRLERSKKWL